jgi:halimadienyl-diphosphate synthase
MRLSNYLKFSTSELLQMESLSLMQSTPYDTAWVAGLTEPDGSLAYPELFDWLLTQQKPDGSWGSRIPYLHDRVLTTLAVVLLLGRASLRQKHEEQRTRGEQYIWQNVGKLHQDFERTVGFEIIVPALLAEAKALGLNLPYAQMQSYETERARKLSLLPPLEKLFSVNTPALFSLEAFGGVSLDSIEKQVLANGAVALSPSATAFMMSQAPDWRTRFPKSTAYLEQLMQVQGAGIPHFAPYEIFWRSWMLYYLQFGKVLNGHEELVQSHYSYLRENWRPEGVGYSALNPDYDADDTSVALLALHRAGYEVDAKCLLSFERERHFAAVRFEREPSTSANLHILECVAIFPEADQARVRDKILSYLLKARHDNAYWSDKWHASVYYPTSTALMVLPAYLPDEITGTLNWLFSTQRSDGSWGQYMPTAEETAMVLLALLHYHRTFAALPTEPMHKAARYLLASERPFENDHPELWIAKVLYAPLPMIRSIILAALGLYDETF